MNKDIVGRKKEQESLIRYMNSEESEFIAIYGRRRVGKTFLVRKLLGDQFSFYIQVSLVYIKLSRSRERSGYSVLLLTTRETA